MQLGDSLWKIANKVICLSLN
nr:hypothetical protein [Bacillus tequilensis]